MEYFVSNKNKISFGRLLLISLIVLSSCNPTKYVPQGESLLDRTYIEISSDEVTKGELRPFIRQQPNKRIFGSRFHLGLYNWSNLEKERWPHGWLRNIGEEPVIFDTYATNRSKEQLLLYLRSKGYFDAVVMETIETSKKKSKVYYEIDTSTPYTIRDLRYEVEDSALLAIIDFDIQNCLISKGGRYDFDDLASERTRIERLIRDHGYYAFSSDFIHFRVNDTIGNNMVDITYYVRGAVSPDRSEGIKTIPHSKYSVRNVYVHPEFEPGEAMSAGDNYFSSLDTVLHNGYNFISPPGKPRVRFDLLEQNLLINPGLPFNVSRTERTQRQLVALKTYRLVNINYNEPQQPSFSESGEKYIDAIIQLTPFNQQSFTYLIEGTNSAGNLGAAVNFIYQHKNLFHGAQQFNLKLKGAYETLSEEVTGFRSTQELGVEASLLFPEFLFPFVRKERFISRYNPKSYLQLAYNFQKIPVYSRTVVNATFGYNWDQGSYKKHMLYPFQMNLVKLPYIDPDFALRIDTSSYLSFSYKDALIMGGSYTYTYNDQIIQRSRDHSFFKFNLELAGNLAALGSRLTDAEKSEDSYTLFGQQFAQYIRSDIDLRYNLIINNVSSVVFRSFIGAGIPYGNSKALPFEKQYFGGGANGVRGWQVRSLGPGSFNNYIPSFINQTADMKLELNAEYRFKLFWILEGAVFLDAGNIWTIKDDPDRPGAVFKFNKFYDDMALSTGFGMRFDLNFVLLRTDIGIKLRDPAIQDRPKWIRMIRPYNVRDDFTFMVGIGYPF
ncbi:MAG: BamA/TamA family outer membrane protein [Bacteroidales bacterium]